jgi:hypothetical protein
MTYPIIECQPASTITNTPQWKFWCDYCATHHHHAGHPDDTGEIGHRSAHCHVQSSPYRATGYILRAGQNNIKVTE